jgi:hypothetical protein
MFSAWCSDSAFETARWAEPRLVKPMSTALQDWTVPVLEK